MAGGGESGGRIKRGRTGSPPMHSLVKHTECREFYCSFVSTTQLQCLMRFTHMHTHACTVAQLKYDTGCQVPAAAFGMSTTSLDNQ